MSAEMAATVGDSEIGKGKLVLLAQIRLLTVTAHGELARLARYHQIAKVS